MLDAYAFLLRHRLKNKAEILPSLPSAGRFEYYNLTALKFPRHIHELQERNVRKILISRFSHHRRFLSIPSLSKPSKTDRGVESILRFLDRFLRILETLQARIDKILSVPVVLYHMIQSSLTKIPIRSKMGTLQRHKYLLAPFYQYSPYHLSKGWWKRFNINEPTKRILKTTI